MMIKRFWFPFAFAILIILTVETFIYFSIHPDFWQKTTWLLHDPYRGEPFDRLIVYEKLHQLLNEKPDIISVGDSSGFFSIQPNIVNRYLHGLKYVSLSTGANQGFRGYKAIAEYALKHQSSIKYVVLNMYPDLLPSKEIFRKADLATIEYDDLVSIKSLLTPPSASLSPYIKSLLFYHQSYHRSDYPSTHKVYLEVRHSIKTTLGWAPEHDVPCDRIYAKTLFYPDREKKIETGFGVFEKSALLTTLNDFAKTCRKYHAKLMIMFNPMPWQVIKVDENLFRAEKLLQKFSRKNPDVIFLTDHLITPWDPAKFGADKHVSRSYVHLSSARMGEALEKAIYDPSSLLPFKARFIPKKFPVPMDVSVIEKATEEEKLAALSYYLYTATTEKKYWEKLSARVQKELTKSQAFNWMMRDMQTKNETLMQQNISLRYDTSKINADVVSLRGGYYCGKNLNVKWIHLSGIFSFGLKSKVHDVTEPVNWPAQSNIIIPIVYEGNAYKFDGYC